jgi:D-serine deaminase-like pyridoxal phosphate-dependent protein
MTEPAVARYGRLRAAITGRPLPCAVVDLDAFEHNVDAAVAAAAAWGKKLRVATKSLRCPELVRRVRERGGDVARGLMTYTAEETAFWAKEGQRDLILAYPTALPSDAALIARANASGAIAACVVDCQEHLALLGGAGKSFGAPIPVIIDIDVAWSPLGIAHVGVRRSSLRKVSDVVALARRAAAGEGLRFLGVMAYEAQLAGVPDASVVARAMKCGSAVDVARRRAEVSRALVEAQLRPEVFNGGGTGSLATSVSDPSLTEVTVGSGFLDSHLFDGYRGHVLRPAAYFALQVARRPGPTIVTCHGGGYVASGSAGPDRLPIPALPERLRLRRVEGAGEVQTPLEVPRDVVLSLGDPVFFRHAKAGELAEHFAEYLLVRGDRIEGRAPTYRGLGHCFLG